MSVRILLVRIVLGCGLVLSSWACIDREPYACDADEQCQGAGLLGRCAQPGFCAVPDGSCESGYSFGRFALPDLVGLCTEPEGSSSSSSSGEESSGSDSSSGSSSSGSSSGDPVPLEDCDGEDNDGDGLIDEWSSINEQCNDCDLYQREGRAYWRCTNDSWFSVQMVCASFGANLASVQDAGENLYLAQRTPSSANWLGLNDVGDEGNYTWVDDEPVVYTNWAGSMQPSDNIDSNCGGINVEGEWLSFNCLNSRPGFCEAPHPD